VKITVLTYLDSTDENSKDYDPVVPQVARTLRRLGHRVSVLGVHNDVKRLITGLSRRKPDLVFNLMEMFGDNLFGDIPVAGLLDLLRLRYTGSGPGELYLSQDKALSKKLLAYEDILYPRFAVLNRESELETGGNLRMPLFVKPLRSDSSLGIGRKSLVYDALQLMRRFAAIREELGDAAIAEEYIEGRELYLTMVGNGEKLQILPAVELIFAGGAKRPEARIQTKRMKWDLDYRRRHGIKTVYARRMSKVAEERLEHVCRTAFRALWLRDYARIDVRLAKDDQIWFIEANANPYLSFGHNSAEAAHKAGMNYEAFIQRIVDEAMARDA
jgi:D-alanine-D-alanine ligase